MENPSFHLEGIVKEKDRFLDFEGPLSLILMLLQKNKIEIRDLSVSDILDQYLEYLDRMQDLDLEIASEFVQMASHLLYLKTRTLLTNEEETSELDILKQSLEQLQARERFAAMSTVIPLLKKAAEKGVLYMTKQPEPQPAKKEEYSYGHKPVDLLKSMLGIWIRSGYTSPDKERLLFSVVPRQIVYSVRDKGLDIITRLRDGPKTLSWFFGSCATSSEIVATFVAVLELCRAGNLEFQRVDEQIVLQLSGSENNIETLLEAFEVEL